MKWNQQKSLLLSQVFVVFFAVLLLAMDIFSVVVVWCLFHMSPFLDHGFGPEPLIITIYACSIPAWITLWTLWRLLRRIRGGNVFCEENVRDMRRTSWCCMAVAIICLVATFFHPLLLIVAAAAAFMGLIVRIVRDSFRQAIAMKDELDFTV